MKNLYFDAHFHLFDNTSLGDNLAANIGENSSSDYFFKKYHTRESAIGGVVMGNGPLETQGENLPDNFYYCVGLDELSYFPLTAEIYNKIKIHLQNPKCVGVKLYPGYLPIYPNDKQYEPIFKLCIECNKVLAIHTGMPAAVSAKLKYTRPIYLDDVAIDFPELKIIMCHFGNPFLEEAAAVMEHNSNVYADLSGLIEGNFTTKYFCETQRDYINLLKTWIKYIGDSKKFMFGTDWPAVNCIEYQKFISQLFDPSWLDDVMINNALKIYNIRLKGL